MRLCRTRQMNLGAMPTPRACTESSLAILCDDRPVSGHLLPAGFTGKFTLWGGLQPQQPVVDGILAFTRPSSLF